MVAVHRVFYSDTSSASCRSFPWGSQRNHTRPTLTVTDWYPTAAILIWCGSASVTNSNAFELVTLAEPHQIRIAAVGYQSVTVRVGRVWFLWLPQGKERHDAELVSE